MSQSNSVISTADAPSAIGPYCELCNLTLDFFLISYLIPRFPFSLYRICLNSTGYQNRRRIDLHQWLHST